MYTEHDKPLLHLFVHIGKLVNEKLRNLLGAKGIHAGQAKILVSLLRHGELTQVAIGRGLHIKSATVTNLIQKMETADLVLRQRDPNDDRVMNVTLTPEGKEAAEFVEEVFELLERDIRSRLSPDAVQMLRPLLETIRNTLGGTDPTL